jgi:hypothetical protein
MYGIKFLYFALSSILIEAALGFPISEKISELHKGDFVFFPLFWGKFGFTRSASGSTDPTVKGLGHKMDWIFVDMNGYRTSRQK